MSILFIDVSVGLATSTIYTCPTGKRARVQILKIAPRSDNASNCTLRINNSASASGGTAFGTAVLNRDYTFTTYLDSASSMINSDGTILIDGGVMFVTEEGSEAGASSASVPEFYLDQSDYISADSSGADAKVTLQIIEEDR